MLLSELKPGQVAKIIGYNQGPEAVMNRLIEMGFVLGASVTVQFKGLVGGDPLAVAVRGGLVGIGGSEARLLEVEAAS